MNELVFTSKKGSPVTSSLLVAEKFEMEHKNVLSAIRNLVAENSAAKFFYESSYENRGKQYPMFIMNRDGFSLLVMGFTGAKALQFKIEFINAFNSMEEKLKNIAPSYFSEIPKSFAEALELAAKQAREIEAKDKLIEKQAPAVDFVARAIDTGHLTDIGQAAKILKLPFGRNTFFKTLREQGVLFKNRNEPKQEYIERGYFELREDEVKRNEHPSFMITKILVTQKGLFWLSKIFKVDYSASLPSLTIQ
jgi:anti-repressor protein